MNFVLTWGHAQVLTESRQTSYLQHCSRGHAADHMHSRPTSSQALLKEYSCMVSAGVRVCAVTGQVREAWAVLAAREGWEKLPKYALGVSSGASMVHDHTMASTTS